MARPVDDDEEQRIVAALATGASCNAIAKEFKRSPDTISRIAHKVGHQFGATNVARAHEARKAYGAERRAATMARFHERCDELLEAMAGQYLVFNFGGRDNTYEEHTLEAPPVEAKRQLVQAARDAMRTVLDIDKHDNRSGEDLSAVDAWLAEIEGS